MEKGHVVDLRSDTVTRPSIEMRNAMANAEVDDDVLGHDPTVQALEKLTASILGKEEAIFTPSGTMANQIALAVQTRPGDEMYIDANAHIYFYEAGGAAVHSGLWPRFIPAKRGVFSVDDLKSVMRPFPNDHFPRPSIIVLENTHNRGSGHVWPIEEIRKIRLFAIANGLKMHLDGARLWNASAASGIAEKEWAAEFDTVAVCFSKGLGAPVGSCVAGTHEFCQNARRVRKLFGGGMRQSGIIAAGALFALQNNRKRLEDDHRHAKELAVGIGRIPGLLTSPEDVETNIMLIHMDRTICRSSAVEIAEQLSKEKVLVMALSDDVIRLVTSLEVDDQDVDVAISAFGRILDHHRH